MKKTGLKNFYRSPQGTGAGLWDRGARYTADLEEIMEKSDFLAVLREPVHYLVYGT